MYVSESSIKKWLDAYYHAMKKEGDTQSVKEYRYMLQDQGIMKKDDEFLNILKIRKNLTDTQIRETLRNV